MSSQRPSLGRGLRAIDLAAATLALAISANVSAQENRGSTWIVELNAPTLPQRTASAGRSVEIERQHMVAEQRDFKSSMARQLGQPIRVSHHFLATANALAVQLDDEQAREVARLPGVRSVRPAPVYTLSTYAAPEFLGADAIWNGSVTGLATRGEGARIGIVDSGLNLAHPSFANDISCGHGTTAPAKLLSVLDCSASDENGLCNGVSPGDTHGHGSHVASTAGGNAIDAGSVPAPSQPIAGIAPCASLRIYRACPGSSCPGANVQAALESVLLHGDLEAVNFSISGGMSPWGDADAWFLDMVEQGMFVAAAAGNTSSSITNPLGQVNHRGPWVTTVAASTHHTRPDELANFSFRGPIQGALSNLTKPDLTSAGVGLYAASATGYSVMSGTSMSTPTVTGAAALLRQIRPEWTPIELKSALMTTASRYGVSDDGKTPWTPDEVGSGRLDVAVAAQAALVLDESIQRFRDANPAVGSVDLRDLNLASLRDMGCHGHCQFTRTLRNTSASATWQINIDQPEYFHLRVTPEQFILASGESVTLTIRAEELWGSSLRRDISFGSVVLTPLLSGLPAQHLSVALRGNGERVRIFQDGFDPTATHSNTLEHSIAATNDGTTLRVVSGTLADNDPQRVGDLNLHLQVGYPGGLALRWNHAPSIGAAVAVNSYSNRYRLLGTGEMVGPESIFSRSSGLLTEWHADVDGYLGFRFDCVELDAAPPSGVCYGYLHLRGSAEDGLPAHVLGYGYDYTGRGIVIP